MSHLRRIWTMDDERADRLADLAIQHSNLARRFGESDCTWQEREEILDRVKAIREERDTILEEIE